MSSCGTARCGGSAAPEKKLSRANDRRKEDDMAYRCDQAIIGGAMDAIRCKVSGTVCAHQKMCLMEGRIVLTDGALQCPARDGQMPEPVEAEKAPEKPAAKPQRKTSGAAKTQRTGKEKKAK